MTDASNQNMANALRILSVTPDIGIDETEERSVMIIASLNEKSGLDEQIGTQNTISHRPVGTSF
jgi:ribosomal protein L12E/L44/L45/RPP1/RPP2